MEKIIDSKKSILIVEDELLIAFQLKNAVIQQGYLCAGIAINYNSAKEILDSTKVDLVLLDVKISGEKTGLDVALLLNSKFGIPFLFITSFNDSETLANIKKLSPKGYINKPINEATLLTTIDIVFDNLKDKTKEFININIGTTTYNINLTELLYIESEHVYVRLHYRTRSLLIRSSLINFLDLLPNKVFLQVNRSNAVNINFIENVGARDIKINTETIKLSSKYKENFLSIFNS
ncbi:response regulator transcription factor [Polaribacter sp. Hel1_85]|uniref:response regulator transcription factor n=1 Tax=Polaribacter sp. Hel1_85 TaxID=1250005 RepID=UPI00052C3BB5|nr:response regulator transcription factor [Polaribacter sp. Hel1_85]KGL62157.1 two-component system response regulator, LytR/AlgR family [Polaribacter sp. Hel1_85]